MNIGAVTEEDFERSFEDVPTISVNITFLCQVFVAFNII